MLGKFPAALLAIAAASASASACAMNSAPAAGARCTVDRPELVPAEAGGAEAICAEIEQAAKAAGVGPLEVKVRVLSPHSLAADVRTAEGIELQEQRMAISDRSLNRSSIASFARAIAAVAAAMDEPSAE